jgi:hypothetical protein
MKKDSINLDIISDLKGRDVSCFSHSKDGLARELQSYSVSSICYVQRYTKVNESAFPMRTYTSLLEAGAQDRADCIFLENDARKLLLLGFPEHASVVYVSLGLGTGIAVGFVGLLRRIVRGELIFLGRVHVNARRWWVFKRNEGYVRSLKKARNFPLAADTSIETLVHFLDKNKIAYAAFSGPSSSLDGQSIPNLTGLLVENNRSKEVKLFLKSKPGNNVISIYDVSMHRGIPYISPPLAQKIIQTSVRNNQGLKVLKPKEDFLRAVYHALYYQGFSSGIPSIYRKQTQHAINGSARCLHTEANKLAIKTPFTMEDLDELLQEEGWRPRLDTLNFFAENNEWIREHFFNQEADIKGLGVLILRASALKNEDKMQSFEQLVEKEGFVILRKVVYLVEQRKFIADNTRGGNWATSSKNNVEDFIPAVAVLIFDKHQLISNERGHNKRIRQLKEDIRAHFHNDKNILSGSSVVHSTDNGLEVWDYISVCFQVDFDELKTEIESILVSQKDKGMQNYHFFRYKIKRMRAYIKEFKSRFSNQIMQLIQSTVLR